MATKGVNRVFIIGNLGHDPEVRYLPSGDAVANLSVATTDTWRDKQTGDKKEATEWHRVAFFGKTAEVCGQYLRKGSKVYIEGSLRTRKWQAQDGTDRYSTEIKGHNMQMLGDPSPGNGTGSGQTRKAEGGLSPEQAPPPDDRPRGQQGDVGEYARQGTAARGRQAPPPSDDDFEDSEVPF